MTGLSTDHRLSPRAARRVGWILVGILLGALALRLVHINSRALWTDEFRHVFAARSMLAFGAPIITEVGEYRRSLPTTCITALSFSLFGESEAAARAPFVAINMVFLVATFFLLRRMFNPGLALIVVAILAFVPDEVRWGRECRMYALFQLLYVLGSLLFFRGFEAVGRRPRSSDAAPAWAPRHPRLNLVLGAAMLLMAIPVHRLSVTFPIAVFAYCLAMLLWTATQGGVRAALATRYALVLAAVPVGIAAVRLLAPAYTDQLIWTGTTAIAWFTEWHAFGFYRWFFLHNYPAFTLLYPIGCILLIRHHGRAGLFVTLSFVALMLVHVTFFRTRFAERYIAYILPFFFIGVAYAVQVLGGAAAGGIRRRWPRRRSVAGAVAMLALSSLLVIPWSGQLVKVLGRNYTTNWKDASALLQQLNRDYVILANWPQIAYYLGDFPDYLVMTTDGRGSVPEDRTAHVGPNKIPIRWLTSVADLDRVISGPEPVCFVTTHWAFRNDAFLDSEMRVFIHEQLVWLDHGGDDAILIYRTAEE